MSISINNYTDSLMNVYNNTTGGTSDTSKMEETLSQDYSKASDEELMNVCKQFESYFTEQVFKALDKMVPKEEYSDSSVANTMDYFKGNLIQEYANSATSQGGLGLAQTLYESMKREYNV